MDYYLLLVRDRDVSLEQDFFSRSFLKFAADMSHFDQEKLLM